MQAAVDCCDQRAGPIRHGLFAWSLLASLLLLATMAGPCLLGRVYTRDDLGAYHLPLRAFYAGQLAGGEPFDWMPQVFCGFYLTGDGQLGPYHPLHLLLYRFLPLPAAWGCELLSSYLLMLAGMFCLLRRHLVRPGAAMFGASVFTFSGFNLLHFVHPNAIAVVAHLPWLLWTTDLLLAGSDRPRVVASQAGIALLTGSQLLLGYPQYVWFSLLAEAGYVLFVITGPRYLKKNQGDDRDGTGYPSRARRVLRPWRRLLIAKAVGLALGAVQLFPTFDALSHSVRRSVDAAFVNSGSLHPFNLIQLVAPYLFVDRVAGRNTHELGLYVGAVPLMLAVWLLISRRKLGRLRRPALAAAACGLLALLLAFGEYGPLYRFQRFLPLVGGFRFPCRYVVLFSLSAAMISAIALLLLVRQQRRNKPTPWPELSPLGIVVAASLLVAILGLLLRDRPVIASVQAVLAGPLLIGVAGVLVTMAARGVRKAPVALALFAVADLGYYGLTYAIHSHTERFDAYVARVRTPPPASGGRVLADPIDGKGSGLRTGSQLTLTGWHQADGYAGLQPARQLDYRTLPALQAAGVRWVRRTEVTAAIEGLLPWDDHWLRVPRPLERIRMVTRTQPTDEPARRIANTPLESVVLVSSPLALPDGSPGTATLVDERPGSFQLRVTCSTPQMLVVAESYHPGWKARIAGRPQSVFRANGDFLACVVPPGEHDVVLQFRPESLRSGLVVSCAGLVLLAALAVAPVGGWASRWMVRAFRSWVASRRWENQGTTANLARSTPQPRDPDLLPQIVFPAAVPGVTDREAQLRQQVEEGVP